MTQRVRQPKGRALIATAAALALAALVGGIYVLNLPPSGPPTRPTHVPVEAVWAGSSSGNWIRCTRQEQEGIFACDIYAEQGDRVHSGQYRWNGSRSSEGLPSLRYWDGEFIIARGGQLTPIGRHTDYFSDKE